MSRGGDYWQRARATANDPTWRQRAACRSMGPAIFFDDSSAEALAVCERCPERRQCAMTAAVTQEAHGVWGGKRRSEPRRTRQQSPREERDEIAARVLELFQRLADEIGSAA